MLREAFSQLCRIVSSPSAIKTSAVTHYDKILSASFRTGSVGQSGWSKFDRSRDSVRQKGSDVSPSSTDDQQISYNKPFKGISFPTLETFKQTFNGVPYDQTHVIHIKATSNNTIVSIAESDGNVVAIQSGGTVGFRNARKGTNVAAQAAAIALSDDAKRKGITQARVCVRGIGPGRFPALKAVEMSGIKVISITDTTPLAFNGNRPKKVRRL